MTALLLQTILLLSIAYFMGAALACVLRRLFAAEAPVVSRPSVRTEARLEPATVTVLPAAGAAADTNREPLRRVDPLPEFSERPSGVSRFTRALTGTTPSEPRPAPKPVPITPPVVLPKVVPPPAAAATGGIATAAAAATVASVLAKPPTTPAAPVAQAPATPVPVAPAPADNLRRIKGIDAGVEAALNKLGVRRYAQIAGWMRPEIANVSQALGLKGRIEQQNWIEQAAILAQGNKTHYVRLLERNTMPMGQPSANAGTPAPVGTTAAGAVSAAVSALKPAPAALTRPPDVENRAAFSAEQTRAPAPPVVPPVAPSKPPAPNPALAAAAAAIAGSAAAADAGRGAHDNLQRISGVTAEIEKALLTNGVTRYGQLAGWSRADVDSFDKLTGGDGRILRENWIEQARILGTGGDTAYSREYDRRARDAALARPTRLGDAIKEQQQGRPPEATVSVTAPPPARTVADLSALRSVKSEAMSRGDNADPPRFGAQTRVVKSAVPDDLKRIRGVGVLIERRLNSLGIVSYDQIANWSSRDIERISQTLDFKGRIERENWVEQARILVSGGQTDFSRRVDRGEVDSSKPKPS